MRRLNLATLGLVGLLGAFPAIAQTAAPSTAPAKAPPPTMSAPSKAAPTPAAAPAPTPAAKLIDINAASKDELATLAGIGPVRAEAIVKGRPYKGKDDLVSKKVIPEGVYNDIKDKIIAHQKS